MRKALLSFSDRLAGFLQSAESVGDRVDADQVFMLACVAGCVELALVDNHLDSREADLIDAVLRMVAATAREEEIAQLRQDLVEAGDRKQVLALADSTLPVEVRRVLLAVFAGIVWADERVHETEQSAFTRIAEALKLDPGPLLVSAPTRGMDWPPGVSLSQLTSLSHPLRAALCKLFQQDPAHVEHVDAPSGTDWSVSLAGVRARLERLARAALELQAELSGTIPIELNERLSELQRNSGPFQLLVLGEFSNGKSTLVNALAGRELLPSSAVPCTAAICRLRHGPKTRFLKHQNRAAPHEIDEAEFRSLVELTDEEANTWSAGEGSGRPTLIVESNVPVLSQGVEIVDSPGLHEHSDRTVQVEEFLRSSDAQLLVLNAARSLGETERELVERLRARSTAQSLFVVLNCADQLRTASDREKVQKRVEGFFQDQVPGHRIWFVSALGALYPQEVRGDWRAAFDGMTAELAKFLEVGPGAGRGERVRADLLTLLDEIDVDLHHQIDALKRLESTSSDDAKKAQESLKQARKQKDKMLAAVERAGRRAADRARLAFSEEMVLFGGELLLASEEWAAGQEDKSKAQQQELYAKKARKKTDSLIKTFREKTLKALVDDELAELRDQMREGQRDFSKLLAAAYGATSSKIDLSAAEADADFNLANVFGPAAAVGIVALTSVTMAWLIPLTAATTVVARLVGWLITDDKQQAKDWAFQAAVKETEVLETNGTELATRMGSQVRDLFHKLHESLKLDLEARLRLVARDTQLALEAREESSESTALLGQQLNKGLKTVRRLRREVAGL